MKRGFTLVELLIALGIMGILAGILLYLPSAPRREARDDRRVADLRQVEQALRLFYLKCGFYPGIFDTNAEECEGGQLDDPNKDENNPRDWNELVNNLTSAEIGISTLPNDPQANQSYEYRVQLGSPGVTPRAQCYILKAQMETTHRSLDDSKELDSINLSNLYPETPFDCGDPNYCIGNIECFYGN